VSRTNWITWSPHKALLLSKRRLSICSVTFLYLTSFVANILRKIISAKLMHYGHYTAHVTHYLPFCPSNVLPILQWGHKRLKFLNITEIRILLSRFIYPKRNPEICSSFVSEFIFIVLKIRYFQWGWHGGLRGKYHFIIFQINLRPLPYKSLPISFSVIYLFLTATLSEMLAAKKRNKKVIMMHVCVWSANF
jgi:hypothetical protein